MELLLSPLFLIVLAVLFLYSAIKILREYERGVIFMLGRFWKVKGPGLIILIPGIQKMVKVSLRMVVLDVPTQDVITRDNVSVKVSAVVYFRVVDARNAVIEVEDYLYATSQLAQTTLRSVLGQAELDDLLAKRDKLNRELQKILDRQTEAWGVKVSNVEVKHVDLPQEMQRAMARQAEAERERRAKIIHANGEFQAAQQLLEASRLLGKNPLTIQLRYLQTLLELSTERATVVLFPVPMDLLRPFLERGLTTPEKAPSATVSPSAEESKEPEATQA